MDKTEFIKLPNFEKRESFDADSLIDAEHNKQPQEAKTNTHVDLTEKDLLEELGL
jgi:hypothetical protein